MNGELVLAVDASTTACKAFAWNVRGGVEAEGRAPIDLAHPAPDGWEQDAEQWWAAWLGAVRGVTAALGPRTAALAALCVTHQRETFVLADAAGVPLAPAVVWLDGRCREQVTQAEQRVGAARLHELSGKPPSTTASVYKLMELGERRPELWRGRPKLLDVGAFLHWRLTGRCATSLASADPTGLVDMRAGRWSAELCALAGLEPDQLPELVRPGARLGVLAAGVADACGLPAGLPVVAGAGDGQAALLGAGIVTPGRAYLNLGTAVVAGVLSADYRCDRAFRTLYGPLPGSFVCESDLKGGTFILSWLAERLLRGPAVGPGDPAALLARLEAEAARLPVGADGLVVVPYWNGVMNPYWDDDARGIALGWSGTHSAAHLYRAILEGICFEQRLVLTAIERATEPIGAIVVLGGGSRSDLFCRILADVLGRPVDRAGSPEATALGAGILAAVGAGLYRDVESAVAGMTSLGEHFEPGPACVAYRQLYEEIYAGLYPALRVALGRLAAWRRRHARG